MSFFERSPVAVFLAASVPCDKCAYPCEAKENSSTANCEKHMEALVKQGKVEIVIQWIKPKEERQPTADAAAVVRCAECRYCYDVGQDPLEPYDGEDVWHCEMWGREVSAYQVDPYRFFCARGERRKAT